MRRGACACRECDELRSLALLTRTGTQSRGGHAVCVSRKMSKREANSTAYT